MGLDNIFMGLTSVGYRPQRAWKKNIKNWSSGNGKVGGGGLDYIDMAQDLEKWRALVNAAMNLLVT
jgi:hypothetical protein